MTAVERSYVPGLVRLRLAVLMLSLFVVGTNGFVIAGVLPEIAGSLHVTAVQAGYSITAYAAVVAVASPAVSIVLARVPRTPLMAGGLLLIAVGTLGAARAGSIAVFVAARALAALGGAALVPAATAAAPSLLPPEQRGRALAVAALGFTLATAVGAPAGTALAAAGGWRLPLEVLAGLALLLAVTVAVLVRGVPIGASASLRARLVLLGDPRLLLDLASTLLIVAAFNAVYLYSSLLVRGATGGSGGALAVLLAVFGVAGVGGAALAGPVTDRWGSRPAGAVMLGATALVFLVLPLAVGGFWSAAAGYALFGFAASGTVVPLQTRIVEIDPATSAVALSWYSTALYAGIAAAPLLGGAAIGFGAAAVPLGGAAATALSLVVFLLGFSVRRGAVRPR